MGGGGVMRAVGKVAGVGIVKSSLRGGVQVSPSSAEHSVMRVSSVTRSPSSSIAGLSVADSTSSASNKSSWEMVDDWEFAGGVAEQEMVTEGTVAASGGGEPIARVVFGGVPSLEEAKEATSDLKDAVDKVYLSSPNYGGAALVSGVSSVSNPEETKDCVAYGFEVTSVPKPAMQAFKLLNESPAVQSVVASLAADPNVWNAVTNNSAYMDFIKSQQTEDKFEDQGSPRSSESSVKLEEDGDGADTFSDFLQKIKTSVVAMVSKTSNFLHSLFGLYSAEKEKVNGGSNNVDKSIGASLMGLAVMATCAQEPGKALIETTCKKTQYPEECISALESDPSSFNANLTGLTRIAVDKSASKLVETLNIVTNLVLNETDYLTWAFLVFCRDSYNTSVHQIQEGLQAFDQHKFEKSYQSVEAVNKAVIECDKQGMKMISQVNTALFRLTKDAMTILDLLF